MQWACSGLRHARQGCTGGRQGPYATERGEGGGLAGGHCARGGAAGPSQALLGPERLVPTTLRSTWALFDLVCPSGHPRGIDSSKSTAHSFKSLPLAARSSSDPWFPGRNRLVSSLDITYGETLRALGTLCMRWAFSFQNQSHAAHKTISDNVSKKISLPHVDKHRLLFLSAALPHFTLPQRPLRQPALSVPYLQL